MLGHQLLLHLGQKHDAKVTVRQPLQTYAEFGIFNDANTIAALDLRDTDRVAEVMAAVRPDAVVNAAGIVKQRGTASDVLLSLEINALLPHRLAQICHGAGARLVHFSTDCIFRGDRGLYQEGDIADAIDTYGRTKYLGEVAEPGCVTLRTSIIGLELHRKTSLIEWFLRQSGEVRGFTNAIFTGITTMEASRLVERILCDLPDMNGLFHVASQPISKFELLKALASRIGRADLSVVPDDSFKCDRSLVNGGLLRHGYVPPAWDEMLDELAERILKNGAPG